MTHQSFTTKLVTTHKVRGFHTRDGASANTVEIRNRIQSLRRFSQITATELDITVGIDADITGDTRNEWFLAVVDERNLPEIVSLRADNAWATATKWQVSTGAFTIPTQVFERMDPRFFRPKSWANLEAQPRQMVLCILHFGDSISALMSMGTIRYTEVQIQRTFGNDNAYSDVHGTSFNDDHGMELNFCDSECS